MIAEQEGECSSRRNEGFTLIELTIVVLIFGFIFASISAGLTIYRKNEMVRTTQSNIDTAHFSIMEFRSIVDRIWDDTDIWYSGGVRYPRPAGRCLPMDHPDYGKEVSLAELAALPASGGCTASCVCLVPGARDANGDGSLDPVLIGAVPVMSIRDAILSYVQNILEFDPEAQETTLWALTSWRENLDGWGRMFTYAVTASMTEASTYEDLHGAIAVETEDGESLTTPYGAAHIVLVSHGPNGHGAYTPEGAMHAPCDTSLVEGENCNDTAVFLNGLVSLANNADYFDDTLRFHIAYSSRIWAGNINSNIWNTNPGNVGVGTEIPEERLHVAGDIYVPRMLAEAYCNTLDGSDCFMAQDIGGVGMSCAAGAMQGVSYRNTECETDVRGVTALTDCPANTVLRAVAGDGSLICDPW
jgi:prepilin-type N-terminal cleavage/methylation domain-containing protein